jgi:hypothetical protein
VAAKAKLGDYRGAAVYFAVSSDRGASFRGDYKLADHVCECCRLALAPANDGSVVAMWRHIFAPNIRDHALAQMYPDGRAGTLRRATFDDWRIDACPHHGPSLAADAAGRLHAVWFTEGPKRSGVFYGRLGNHGVEALRRMGGETAEHADLALIGERIAVAWKEFDGERSQLRAMLRQPRRGQGVVLRSRPVDGIPFHTRDAPVQPLQPDVRHRVQQRAQHSRFLFLPGVPFSAASPWL